MTRRDFRESQLFEQLDVLLGNRGKQADAAVRRGDLARMIPQVAAVSDASGLSVEVTEHGLLIRLGILQICYVANLVLVSATSGLPRLQVGWRYPEPFASRPMVLATLPNAIADYTDIPDRGALGEWLTTQNLASGNLAKLMIPGSAALAETARITRVRAIAIGLHVPIDGYNEV